MYRKVLLSVFLTLSLNAVAYCKVIRCIDDDGHIYFTDSSCPRTSQSQQDQVQPDISDLIVNENPKPVTGIKFWCNPGDGRFVRC